MNNSVEGLVAQKMQSTIIILMTLIKRSLIDLPRDCYCWARFYFRRTAIKSDAQEELVRTGLANLGVIQNSTTVPLLEKVMKDLDAEKALSNGGQQTGRVSSNGLIDDRLAPTVSELRPIAEQYLNTKRIKLELTYLQLSRPQDNIDDIPGGAFHIDDNKPNIKFFIYLNDVGPLNGPFKVIPGSHGLTRKKLGRFLRWSLFKRRSDLYAGSFLQLDTTNAMQMLGERGCCFAVDTTAWHMAEPVTCGERRVFVCSFNMA